MKTDRPEYIGGVSVFFVTPTRGNGFFIYTVPNGDIGAFLTMIESRRFLFFAKRQYAVTSIEFHIDDGEITIHLKESK